MQDRFRFRVWDKEHMIYDAEFAYDTMTMNNGLLIGTGKYFQCEYFGKYLERPEHYIVMQCTGLKDKNGKLIYEGDIVERDHVQGKKQGVVVFDKEALQFKATNMSLYSFVHRSVVIGNIYENPELLESN